jgi:hypothetical protein
MTCEDPASCEGRRWAWLYWIVISLAGCVLAVSLMIEAFQMQVGLCVVWLYVRVVVCVLSMWHAVP